MNMVVFAVPSSGVVLGGKLSELAEELKSFLPGFQRVIKEFEEIEVKFCRPLLQCRSEELGERFREMLPVFSFHVVSAVFPVFSNIFLKSDVREVKACLRKLMNFEKEFFEEFKSVLVEKAALYGLDSDSVVKIHAAVIDYDLWIIESVLETGFYGFLRRLSERAEEEVSGLVKYFYSLLYVVMCVDSVLFKNTPYRKDVLEILIDWGSRYAEEVEDYLDTLSLLVSDETYKVLADFYGGLSA